MCVGAGLIGAPGADLPAEPFADAAVFVDVHVVDDVVAVVVDLPAFGDAAQGDGSTDNDVVGVVEAVEQEVVQAVESELVSGSAAGFDEADICDDAVHSLDGNYCVFGKVVEGMDVVHAIAAVPTGGGDRPVDPPKLLSVTIQ